MLITRSWERARHEYKKGRACRKWNWQVHANGGLIQISLDLLSHLCRVSWQTRLTTHSEHYFAILKQVDVQYWKSLCSLLTWPSYCPSWLLFKSHKQRKRRHMLATFHLGLHFAAYEEKEAILAMAKESHQLLTPVGCPSLETVAHWPVIVVRARTRHSHSTTLWFEKRVGTVLTRLFLPLPPTKKPNRRQSSCILVKRACRCTRHHHGTILLLV